MADEHRRAFDEAIAAPLAFDHPTLVDKAVRAMRADIDVLDLLVPVEGEFRAGAFRPAQLFRGATVGRGADGLHPSAQFLQKLGNLLTQQR